MTATIYFAGGEDSDFTSVGTVAVDTTSSHRRTAFCRCALQANDGDSFWNTGNIMSVASAWFHARVWMTSNSTSRAAPLAEGEVFRIVDANGITRLALLFNNTTGAVSNADAAFWFFGTVNAAGSFTQLGSALSGIFAGSPSSPDSLDVQVINYATGGSGTVNIWINGALVFTVSSATLATDANTTINGLRLAGSGASTDVFGHDFAMSYSEVIIADSDTRFMSLATLTPAADGNTVNWTTGGVSNINETTLNDTTTNTSLTADQIQEYTIGALPAGSFGVIGLVTTARAQKGSVGGPTQLNFVVRTGGTDYTSADIALATSLGRVQNVFYTNPSGSSAWTTTDLGAVGFNIGVKSVS